VPSCCWPRSARCLNAPLCHQPSTLLVSHSSIGSYSIHHTDRPTPLQQQSPGHNGAFCVRNVRPGRSSPREPPTLYLVPSAPISLRLSSPGPLDGPYCDIWAALSSPIRYALVATDAWKQYEHPLAETKGWKGWELIVPKFN